MLEQEADDWVMHPKPLVIQLCSHALHYLSVLYDVGAFMQVLGLQGAGVLPVPMHGPSIAVNVEQESIVPVNYVQVVDDEMHPKVPLKTQFFVLLVYGG